MGINEAVSKVMQVDKIVPLAGDSVDICLLASHESITKLWESVVHKEKDSKEINRKLASALIGILLLAGKLQIKDLETEFIKRLQALENE